MRQYVLLALTTSLLSCSSNPSPNPLAWDPPYPESNWDIQCLHAYTQEHTVGIGYKRVFAYMATYQGFPIIRIVRLSDGMGTIFTWARLGDGCMILASPLDEDTTSAGLLLKLPTNLQPDRFSPLDKENALVRRLGSPVVDVVVQDLGAQPLFVSFPYGLEGAGAGAEELAAFISRLPRVSDGVILHRPPLTKSR